MALPSNLVRKLKEALGEDASEALMDWMGEVDSRRDELADVRADLAELRQDMQVGFAKLDAKIDAKIDRSTADLMKWSFVFWVGAVAAIAALAGVLRR
jgi:hypothetical protein